MGKKVESIYHLNAMSHQNSLAILLKPETKTFEAKQKAIYIQPAIIYTNMLGKRLIRIINAEIPIVSNTSNLFVTADSNVIVDFYLKRCNFVFFGMQAF